MENTLFKKLLLRLQKAAFFVKFFVQLTAVWEPEPVTFAKTPLGGSAGFFYIYHFNEKRMEKYF